MIELETYVCPHCEAELTTAAIKGLDGDIETELEESRAATRREVEREFDGMVDPGDLPVQPQTMKELAAAIRTGDKATAELMLDRVADDLGHEHVNAVQIGRYSPASAIGGAS